MELSVHLRSMFPAVAVAVNSDGHTGEAVQTGADGAERRAPMNATTREHRTSSGFAARISEVAFAGAVFTADHVPVTEAACSMKKPSSSGELSAQVTRTCQLFCGMTAVAEGAWII